MFYVLQRSAKFLTEDVTDWPQSAAYQTSAGNVQAVNVINDSAEREKSQGREALPNYFASS